MPLHVLGASGDEHGLVPHLHLERRNDVVVQMLEQVVIQRSDVPGAELRPGR